MKRLFDIICSFVILFFFFPFGVIISFVIGLTSRGGVFYRQERIGKNGVPFILLKFRSMTVNADKKGMLTVGMRDNRITPIGYFIRKYKLDEFPQFINVLKGEMSIVGPRPEVREFVDLYTQEQREVLQVKPGITDLASLAYFEENALLAKSNNPRQTYIEEVMPAKIELNKTYLQNPTLANDLKIMWQTFMRIVR